MKPFYWNTVLVPVFMHWGRIDLLSDSAMIGGSIPCPAGCYLTFFRLAKQATKQVSKQLAKSLSNCENMDNLTAPYTSYLHFTFGTDSMHASPRAYGTFVFFTTLLFSSTNLCCLSSGSEAPRELSSMHRLLRPVRVKLRRIHAGIIQLPLFRFVSLTFKNFD